MIRVHASCVAIGGRAVLLFGASGAGKSDLAFRLIDEGAALVSDDYTLVVEADGALLASAPANIAGRIEVRGVGLLAQAAVAQARVALLVAVDQPVDLGQLGHAESRRKVGHPVVVTHDGEPVAALWIHALTAEQRHLAGQLGVVGLGGECFGPRHRQKAVAAPVVDLAQPAGGRHVLVE